MRCHDLLNAWCSHDTLPLGDYLLQGVLGKLRAYVLSTERSSSPHTYQTAFQITDIGFDVRRYV
jgi:hypothetical protein